jgi:hypothetical protein
MKRWLLSAIMREVKRSTTLHFTRALHNGHDKIKVANVDSWNSKL